MSEIEPNGTANGHKKIHPPRVLIVDDNPAIHEDFRKVLGEQSQSLLRLGELEQALFGSARNPDKRSSFRLDSACQGKDALSMLEDSLKENDPYALAFIDVRMPPGWDGLETLDHLWQCYPDLQAVICTAYTDFSWEEIMRRLKPSDNLLILKKPFDSIEVLQIAHTLTKKCELGRQARLRAEDLDRMVQDKTLALRSEVEERQRIEETLRQSEERFSKAFHASPLPMAIKTSADGRFLDANASFLELTGFKSNELKGNSATDLKLWREDDTKIIKSSRIREHIRGQQFALRRRDGKSRNALIWTEPITLGNEAALLLIIEDISDRLKMENQLRQAQKMDAIGSLATGLAHEFNNLLTVIQGHAGLLRTRVGDSRPGLDSLERISQASVHAASLTRRLLTLSRKQPLQLRSLDLSECVKAMRITLSRLIGERYTVSFECDSQIPAIQGDDASLQQVLINLVLNARDSMPSGGNIRVQTDLVNLDAEAARDHLDARIGQFVCLTVSDKGCGMTPDIATRIFDPFFTTKDFGKSNGLGLSSVQGIVQQHNGWIQLTTNPGEGSTFKVLFPTLETQSLEIPDSEPFASLAPAGAGEAVLVVEEEATVREMARLTLEQGGYRVFEAADSAQALAVWEASPVHIDLLVTEFEMPNGITGADLARNLTEKDPHLRAIFTSAYAPDVSQKDGLQVPEGQFLCKPYDPITLLKTVRSSLK